MDDNRNCDTSGNLQNDRHSDRNGAGEEDDDRDDGRDGNGTRMGTTMGSKLRTAMRTTTGIMMGTEATENDNDKGEYRKASIPEKRSNSDVWLLSRPGVQG